MPETMTLIIKAASLAAAVDAAYHHGLIENPAALKGRTLSGGQVRLDVLASPSRLALAATWFCEPGESIEGRGYPEGSLLLYR